MLNTLTSCIAAFLIVLGSVNAAFLPHLPLPRPAISLRTVRAPILMYHYISANPSWPADPLRTRLSVPPEQLAVQLDYLQRAAYRTITLDDLAAALRDGVPLPEHPVVLTFDDGYVDFYTNAYPLLQRYGSRATVYVITQKIGTPGYMTWDQLRELAASPFVTIGAHTLDHALLTSLPAERSWEELAGSKAELEAQLGVPVRHLSYPSGHYNPLILQQTREIGFVTAVTTHEGVDERSDQLLELRRVRVNGGAALSDLLLGLAGRRAELPVPTPDANIPIPSPAR